MPIVTDPPASPPLVDFAAQRRAIWKGRRFTSAEVAEMRSAELEGED